MTIEEVAYDMARTLLVDPRDEVIEVWREEDDWGWGLIGESTIPAGAELLVQDRVINSDVDPSHDQEAVDRYALDLLEWLQSLVDE